MPSRPAGSRVRVILMVALGAVSACLVWPAGAPATSCAPWTQAAEPGCAPPTGPELTLEQVRQIALREATRNGDAHPTSILVASGPLRKAETVMSPGDRLYPHPSPQEQAELDSSYYLVAIHGRFPLAYGAHSHPAPHVGRGGHNPPHHPFSPVVPKVLELLLSAHAGYGISGFSYGPKVPAPLRLLGPVTRLA